MPTPPPDPDRFLNYQTPGAQEWWYFDAISHDGRDALVAIFFAALPFDPSYGVAARRHLQHPDRFPQPHALDHCAFNLSWYRDGKPFAYALNRHHRDAFHHASQPFQLAIATNRLTRDSAGYHLAINTPALHGGILKAELTFTPAPDTTPFEQDLGTQENPHLWILAAPDNQVAGNLSLTRPETTTSCDFQGRGYHDHNAGAQEISLAIRRWTWGRAHQGPLTHVYYHSLNRQGLTHALRLTCHHGKPTLIQNNITVDDHSPPRSRNLYGLTHARHLHVGPEAAPLVDLRDHCVDNGPFYRRWLGRFRTPDTPPNSPPPLGISELLDTRSLNHPLFNWMIPYRLKHPPH